MAYADLNGVHNPSAGVNDATAAWGDQIRDNQVFLATPPYAHAYKAAAQSISDSSSTRLTFDSERADTDTIHSTVTNTGRFTCVTAGYYEIFGAGNFAANSTGVRILQAYLNGASLDPFGDFEGTPNALVVCQLSVSFAYPLAVNDYIEFFVYQSSGGALNATFEAGIAFLGF